MKNNVICLMGPTASGKTRLALELTEQLPIEIISVDSALIYRGMDIGTAKPTRAERGETPHHLIDICDPSEAYSAGRFCEEALQLIDEIFKRGKQPLLVGGTFLYFHLLQQGVADLPDTDLAIRADITQTAETKGWAALHAELEKIDPASAARIRPSDPQRIGRALELYAITGKPMSTLLAEQPSVTHPFSFVNVVLAYQDRTLLHQKIAERFEGMLDAGFLDEVKALYDRGDLTTKMNAIRTVGYRQAWDYLAGNVSLEQMKELAIIATRQFAKRQYTWLNKWRDGKAIFLNSEDNLGGKELINKIRKLI